jgi:hypothetical protein
VSFTLQGLVRKNGNNDQFGAELAWAFAKIRLNDDFSLRLGRIGLPVYMISDVRNVGYANIMLRPPNEVYRQVTADNADGGDIIYQHSFGDSTITAQAAVGRTKVRSPGNYYRRIQTGDIDPGGAGKRSVHLSPRPFARHLRPV